MGMYTEVFFRAEITREAADVIEAVSLGVVPEHGYPDHSFFRTPRFGSLFTTSSAYFPGDNEFRLVRSTEDDFARYGSGAELRSILSFRSSFKNYDDEAEQFFEWIDPHVHGYEGDFLGYTLYEEDSQPTLHFKATR